MQNRAAYLQTPVLQDLAAACCLAASLLLCTSGCGSGTPAGGPQQSLAVPVASANGPQLGYIWLNQDRTLRPVLGLPGASQIGQSIVPAAVYTNAVTSASASLAVLQAADGSFDLMRLPSGTAISLNFTLPPGANMRLSPSGTAALLYSPGAASASLVTGLPSIPKIQNISAPAAIADAALSDSGTVGLEYAADSYLALAITPLSGRSTSVAAIAADGGLSFMPGRDDLIVADAAANTLTLFRNASTAPSSQPIAAPGLLKTPSSVGVSRSGRWALVTNRDSQSMVRIDLASLVAVSVVCSCKPTLAEPLADDGAFRVTSLASAPNWLIDASAATPRVLFIPAPRVSSPAAMASLRRP